MTDDTHFPRVTVITPSLNQGAYLAQCIQSVADQNYPNLEHFVIDGGSTDATLSVIRDHAALIAYWVSEPDRGQSNAINKGLRRASGELVAWLNADDYYLPGSIEQVVGAYQANLFAPFYFGDGLRVSASAQVMGKFFPPGQLRFDRKALLMGLNYILQPATFINRSALEESGYLDEGLHYGMDSDLWMRLSALGDPCPIQAVLAATREYPSTKTASGSFKRVEELRQISLRHTGLSMTPGVLCYMLDTLSRHAREHEDIFPADYLAEIASFWSKTAKLLERQGATTDGFPLPRASHSTSAAVSNDDPEVAAAPSTEAVPAAASLVAEQESAQCETSHGESPSGPLVTIVTPSFNQGRFIRATIESVLGQDYPNIEYIVMDGNSTDETASVVQEYQQRLTWISEADRGQSHAINKGFRMAKGEIVAWLNSDDLLLPGAVTHAVKAFTEHPDAGAVYGEGYLIDEGGGAKVRFPITQQFDLWSLIHVQDYILQQTVFFRRSALEEVGYLNESLNWGMDWDILIRIGKRFGLHYIPQYMGALREYGDTKTFSGGVKRFRELSSIMRAHGSLRYPPGYFMYGLDIYAKHVTDRIRQLTPPFLQGPSERLCQWLSTSAKYWILRAMHGAKSRYADGWASPTVHYMLPPGNGEILIRGNLPEWCSTLLGQKLTVEHSGRIIANKILAYGDFEIPVRLPFPANAGPVTLTLRASRCIIPAKAGLGPDPRRLAYMLKSIDWAKQARASTAQQ